MGAVLAMASSARAHQDPGGCFETGVSIVVTVLRADGSTGVVGSVSECETINYSARLTKGEELSDDICAFSEGTFSLTLPNGTTHTISSDVPCIGGDGPGEGCDPTVTRLESQLFPYTVTEADVVGGFVTATALYTGGVAHDSENNTPGVGAETPKQTPVTLCEDNDLCTDDVCDPNIPGSAACSFTPIVCNDNTVCTTDQCVAGQCQFNEIDCDDNNLCTIDTCDPETGCANTPKVCDDNNACTQEACNPANGNCETTGENDCDDNNACTQDVCNPANNTCTNTDTVTPTCDDNDECTEESCDPATGQCQEDSTTTCNDNDICTDDVCNPETGLCEFTFDPENDESCRNDAICRTPGFWKTHGAVSQQVIGLAGGCLEVCGEVITTATASSVNNANSVLEAMCTQPRGEHRLQLVRQLTALALNCVISEFGPDCSGDTGLGELFADCNEACLENDGVGDCIAAIDCFNNGGVFNETTGLCGEDPGDSCHEQPLPETIDQGPADTAQACNAAAKSPCATILTNEAACTSGNESPNPETCP
jgi:hypothetical protein